MHLLSKPHVQTNPIKKRFNSCSVHLYSKAGGREDVQLALLARESHALTRVAPGNVWSGDITDVLAFAVVPLDNTSFNASTLDHNLFVSKGRGVGCGNCLFVFILLDIVIHRKIRVN